MSCFLVSRTHIDTLVALHSAHSHYEHLTDSDLTKIGRMLIRANVRSIEARYPDAKGNPDSAPGPTANNPERAWPETYEWRPVAAIPRPVAGIKLVHCYEYQSCEFSGWETSDAARWCRALASNLVAAMPGYDDAPWAI